MEHSAPRRKRTQAPAANQSSPATWQISRVLLASDGSPHSARAAKALAGLVAPNSLVRIVTVAGLEYAEYDDKWGALSDEPERKAALKKQTDAAFAKPIEQLTKTGCRVETTTRLGNAPEQIMFEINEWKPELVVVGRRGQRRLRRLVLGSVSDHLVKNSPVPVLIVP